MRPTFENGEIIDALLGDGPAGMVDRRGPAAAKASWRADHPAALREKR